MGAILAIAMKDLSLLVRDRGNAFFVFLFPILVAIFFGTIFSSGGGQSSDMDVVIVDEDSTPASARFVADLTASGGLAVTPAADRAAGENLVRTNKVVACIVVTKGFQDAADNMFAGKVMQVEAIVDPRHNAEAGLLTGKLNEVAFQQMSRGFTDVVRMDTMLDKARASVRESKGMDPARRQLFESFFDTLHLVTKDNAGVPAKEEDGEEKRPGFQFKPVEVTISKLAAKREGPPNAYAVSFPQGVVWGLMGCVTAFGASLANERTRGTLTRLAIAPITRAQILLGKALACFLTCLLVQCVLVAMACLPLFKAIPGSWPMMAAVVALNSVGFTGIMMLMAGVSRTEGSAAGLGRALILILAMIGGGTVPLYFMPRFMQTISSVSPFKWATMAMEGAMWRQYSAQDMALPAAVLLFFGVVGFAIGSMAFRWSSDK